MLKLGAAAEGSQLAGLRYRKADVPRADESEQPERLVLSADAGAHWLAFQFAPGLVRPQWPTFRSRRCFTST